MPADGLVCILVFSDSLVEDEEQIGFAASCTGHLSSHQGSTKPAHTSCNEAENIDKWKIIMINERGNIQ